MLRLKMPLACADAIPASGSALSAYLRPWSRDSRRSVQGSYRPLTAVMGKLAGPSFAESLPPFFLQRSFFPAQKPLDSPLALMLVTGYTVPGLFCHGGLDNGLDAGPLGP